tara:strand:+ start:605 stop:946 length:342 start_codon:yes stop_codon:yes gene_type:complete
MKTSSAKAKGRNLQKWVVSKLIEHLQLDEEDLESRPMGSSGEDIIMGKLSRQKFPYSVECKNQEKVNVWSAYEQAESNSKGYEPVVVIKKNRKKPLVVIDAEYFVKLHEEKEI